MSFCLVSGYMRLVRVVKHALVLVLDAREFCLWSDTSWSGIWVHASVACGQPFFSLQSGCARVCCVLSGMILSGIWVHACGQTDVFGLESGCMRLVRVVKRV